MAEIVNLRRARKAKKRAEDAANARTNRAAHGRAKAERRLTTAAAERLGKQLDGAQRE